MSKPVKNGTSKRPAARTDDSVTPPHGDPLENQVTARANPSSGGVSGAKPGGGQRREIDMRAAQARWAKKNR